jgi:hypothetical protein
MLLFTLNNTFILIIYVNNTTNTYITKLSTKYHNKAFITHFTEFYIFLLNYLVS